MASNNRVAAVGVGYSTTGRKTGLTSRQLAVQAATAAMRDAGMTPKDIDGASMLWAVAGDAPPGLDVVDSMDIAYMLGIGPLNFWNSGAGPAYIGPAVQAVAAIKAGLCHTVLSMRVIRQRLTGAEMLAKDTDQQLVYAEDDFQFVAPFGSISPLQAIASMPAQRHMDLYGTTEEHFGRHVVAQREWASHNPDAIFRTPLTLDDYFASRYVSKPVRLLDCDYPVDSASAIIYTTEERARDFAKKPVFAESTAFSSVKYLTFENLDDIIENSPDHCARNLWARTDLKPKDVDCVQLYDGFTIIVFQWLEALGFCGRGEAGPFIAEGHTAMGGRLPLNTDGGACNVGRRHGANFCIESIRQLRGDESGVRQVPDAKVALWANAVGSFSGAMLMTAE
ncbi:MAG: putative lipid transfer protein [Phenylobacterium sp.]|nr:putative lipid transfer protein [Phenylobacterium sp.]